MVEETWEGEQIFYHQLPIPIKEETGPPLSDNEVQEKENTYKKGNITREEALQWVITQLQRKSALVKYDSLLKFYWILLRLDQYFEAQYVHYGQGDYINK